MEYVGIVEKPIKYEYRHEMEEEEAKRFKAFVKKLIDTEARKVFREKGFELYERIESFRFSMDEDIASANGQICWLMKNDEVTWRIFEYIDRRFHPGILFSDVFFDGRNLVCYSTVRKALSPE